MYGLIVMLSLSWVNECVTLINREAVIHNDKYVTELVYAIPQGIHLSNVIDEVERSDEENLNRCALTLAVARYESTFNVKARNKTCLGMYQMTVSTIKDVIKDLSFLKNDLRTELYSPLSSTVIFNLLMNKWGKRGVFKSLIRYNNSDRISRKILKYYEELK